MNENIEKTEKIVKTARNRVAFRKHLTVYILTNLFLWITWYFVFNAEEYSDIFNPIVYVTLAWSLFVIGHYFIAFRWNKNLVEKEVEAMIEEAKSQEVEESSKKLEEKSHESEVS